MTVRRRDRAVVRQLRTLFDIGTIGELTDGQLLERFATDPTEAAELAFAAIVERHGPLVLSVCRSILRDEHAADDAFQATFLVLANKARSLWVKDSLGPWLYQVAYRTASCALAATRRRRKHETRFTIMAASRTTCDASAGEFDLQCLLHEELGRLPQKYEAPLVLCDLQGNTHQQAARRLGWPIGTVKTRLTRGREMLRARLVRRSVAVPAALVAVEAMPTATTAALPSELARNTLDAVSRAAGRSVTAAAVSTQAAALAHGTLRAMLLAKLSSLALFGLLIGLGLAGAYGVVRGPRAGQTGGQTKGGTALAARRSPTRPPTPRSCARSIKRFAPPRPSMTRPHDDRP